MKNNLSRFKVLSKWSKRGQHIIRKARYELLEHIDTAYKKPSSAKVQAYNELEHYYKYLENNTRLYIKNKGVSSHNCFTFTYSVYAVDIDTGASYYILETANNSYIVID